MNEPMANEPRTRILVVDDEDAMRDALCDVLGRAGWEAEGCACPAAALERLRSGPGYRLMMTDYRMDGMNGLELTRAARAVAPEMPIVMMTAYGTVEDAVAAMKGGADEYLLKPFSFETVLEVTRGLLDKAREARPARGSARTARVARTDSDAIIGAAPAWREALRTAEDVAASRATVLLTGESGTGKEIVARHIHERSGRPGAFVAVNCAALPEGVLESELFGHEKGAFTGAILARKGRFEMADGGTILLDEISEMPLSLQAKLLRVLQEREVSPVGGEAPVKLDLRVIATTNRDLEAWVAEGNFRTDLFYRLNVIALGLPPLRERREDIIPLARHFLRRYRRADRAAREFSPEVLEYFASYAWPGNVRELENLIERASLLARGERIRIEDLRLGRAAALHSERVESPPAVSRPSALSSERPRTLEAMERRMILDTLEETRGNRTRAAEALGVSVRTIRNKLNHYGMKDFAIR